jgi:hypothetical protein
MGTSSFAWVAALTPFTRREDAFFCHFTQNANVQNRNSEVPVPLVVGRSSAMERGTAAAGD